MSGFHRTNVHVEPGSVVEVGGWDSSGGPFLTLQFADTVVRAHDFEARCTEPPREGVALVYLSRAQVEELIEQYEALKEQLAKDAHSFREQMREDAA